MESQDKPKNQLKHILVITLILISISLTVSSDSPPTIYVDVEPLHTAIGDLVAINATATDDVGVKGIYFYYPDGKFTFENCSEIPPYPTKCTKNITAATQKLGTINFCVKALDSNNQLSDLACREVKVSTDRPPILKYFYSEQTEGDQPTVHVGGTVKFDLIAEDDNGIIKAYIEDMTTRDVVEYDCGGLKNCIFEHKRRFEDEGLYKFCAWAIDETNKTSGRSCIDVKVISKYKCELITIDGTETGEVVAVSITTKRLRMETDGLLGYSTRCCMEHGFCKDLRIDTLNCEKIDGILEDGMYNLHQWDPSKETIEQTLKDYKYPQVLCTTVRNNKTYMGVIDNYNYRIVGQTENLEDAIMSYWLMGEYKTPSPPPSQKDILIYTSGGTEGDDPGGLKAFLEQNGYNADVIIRGQKITLDLLSQYNQVWIMETSPETHLDTSEVDAVVEYHNNGGNVLLTGEGDYSMQPNLYIRMLDDISQRFQTTFSSASKLNNNQVGCVSPIKTGSHPVLDGVNSLCTSGSDAILTTTNPNVQTIGKFSNDYGTQDAGVLVMESEGGKGRMLFDTSFLRLVPVHGAPFPIGPEACSDSTYILNIAKWLGGSSGLQAPLASSAIVSSGAERFFFAEQLNKENNDTRITTIVDAERYSEAMNRLMEAEMLEKDLESGECQFDCLEPQCNPGAPCGSNACLGCPYPPPCECCPQCHKVLNYREYIYRKYENMYGRPYVDYLFCWKVPGLKSTPWCYQKSDQPTSTVNFPWYGMTRTEEDSYRSLEKITEEYIDDLNKWNENVEVRERPDPTNVATKEWVPEVYCNHNYDPKLFRNIWTKIFTVTPRLEDVRNNLTWTRTGPGVVYAGGGFRREPACWWECCRRCAPYCNCACTPCSGICCLQARFSPSSVENVMEIKVPYTTVSDSGMQISYEESNTVAIVDNGAIKVISTGNMPFQVSASFSKAGDGRYILTQIYTPLGGYSGNKNHVANYDQFVIAQDIMLKYELLEGANDFTVGIKQTFKTKLIDRICSCVEPIRTCPLCAPICPPGCGDGGDCCCCPTATKEVVTEESVEDSDASQVFLDTKKISALKTAASGFIDIALQKHVKVGLVGFSSAPCPGGICSSTPITDNVGTLKAQIGQYQPFQGTCISCGMSKARSLFSAVGGEKHMIVMSDGVPQCCTSSGYQCGEDPAKDQARGQSSSAKGAGIVVHTVALGNNADKPFMEELATIGGGRYYEVTCECPLECVYEELAKLVNGSAVLVNDVSGSMEDKINLNCPAKGIPIIHKFGAVNISVSGNIDNYLDSTLTTGVRSVGQLKIQAKPDIISEFTLNMAESSIDYYSMVYPVRHDAYRKRYAHGYWIPGYPYAIGEPNEFEPRAGFIDYYFDDSYGYENDNYNYPEQCKRICPANCFCPDDDITDVTCLDAEGEEYKRTDCVCMPPEGHSFETICTSDRTYHEEEGYYFDFVEFETRDVSANITLMEGQHGTNPHFTGNLRGVVGHGVNLTTANTTYVFISNSKENTVSKVRATDCAQVCKYNVGGNPSRTVVDLKGEVWVGNRNSGDITRMASDSCNTIGNYRVGSGPRAMVVDGDGNIWVGCSDDNTLWKLDGNTGNCLIGDPVRNPTCPSDSKPIHVEDYPYGGVYDCNGNVWITCQHSNTVYKIRTSDAQVIGKYDIGDVTYGIAVDRNGDIWLGGYTSGNVYKVDGNTGSIICKKKVGGVTRGIAIDQDDNAWLADSAGNNVIKIDGSNCELINRYPVGTNPIGVGIDFEERVWVVNYDSDSATKLDMDGNQICTASVGKGPYTYSDMSGYNIWNICNGEKITHSYVIESNGSYVLDFEALNFPNPLLKYDDAAWRSLKGTLNRNCNEYCESIGLFAAPKCTCPKDASLTSCSYANSSSGDMCISGCDTDMTAYDDSECCCTKLSFKSEDANMTFYIHFRNNVEDQTFPLFPARTENKPYATVNIDVTIRDPSKTLCEISPESASEGEFVNVSLRIVDALTGAGIPYAKARITVESYGLKLERDTDGEGRTQLQFIALDQNTAINCSFAGDDEYTPSSKYRHLNVYSVGRFWWFLSPEVLLLLIVLLLLAFSYKWFKGSNMDLNSMWDEIRGKK